MGTNSNQPSALIVARPGDLRDGLYSLLTVTDGITSVLQADTARSAMRLVVDEAPELIILDFDLPRENMVTLLASIKAHSPRSRCLALAEHAEQREMAQGAGADLVLMKGALASELLNSVRELLARDQ